MAATAQKNARVLTRDAKSGQVPKTSIRTVKAPQKSGHFSLRDARNAVSVASKEKSGKR